MTKSTNTRETADQYTARIRAEHDATLDPIDRVSRDRLAAKRRRPTDTLEGIDIHAYAAQVAGLANDSEWTPADEARWVADVLLQAAHREHANLTPKQAAAIAITATSNKHGL